MPLDATSSNETELLRRELYETREKLARIDQNTHESLKAQAFEEALKPHGLAPDAADQVKRLLGADVRLQADESGRLKAVGPGLQPLGQFVGDALAKPEFARFRGGAAAPTAALPFGTDPRSFGEAIIADRVASRPRTDPRLDPSQSMGLGRGPMTPFAQQRDDGKGALPR